MIEPELWLLFSRDKVSFARPKEVLSQCSVRYYNNINNKSIEGGEIMSRYGATQNMKEVCLLWQRLRKRDPQEVLEEMEVLRSKIEYLEDKKGILTRFDENMNIEFYPEEALV
jgi:hypothetical protein